MGNMCVGPQRCPTCGELNYGECGCQKTQGLADLGPAEPLIRAAVRVVITPVLRLLQGDPHQWSKRPCATCRAVSSIVGEPFGCLLFAKQEPPHA